MGSLVHKIIIYSCFLTQYLPEWEPRSHITQDAQTLTQITRQPPSLCITLSHRFLSPHFLSLHHSNNFFKALHFSPCALFQPPWCITFHASLSFAPSLLLVSGCFINNGCFKFMTHQTPTSFFCLFLLIGPLFLSFEND